MPASSRITAKFDADTKDLSKGVSTVIGRLSKLTAAAKRSNSTLAKIGRMQAFEFYTRIGGMVTNATRSMIAWGNATREAIDQSAKAARNLGTTYAAFEGMRVAASEAGLGVEQMFDVMKDLTKNTAAAVNGAGGAADAFKQLGLNAAELSEMSAEERLYAVIDALQGIENTALRSAMAMQIFGEQGIRMGSLIAGGSAGMRDAANAARELGLTLNQMQSGNVEAMNDAIGRVGMSFTGITNQITANIAPAITGIAKAWEAFARDLGGAEIGEYIADALWDALEYAASWVDTVSGYFEGLAALVGGEADAWTGAANLWAVVWDTAGRVWDLADSVWSLMMSGFNTILQGITYGARKIAEAVNLIPGVSADGIIESLKKGEQYFEDGANSWYDRAGKKFESALSTTRDIDAQTRQSGASERAVESWRERALAARRERDRAVQQAAKQTPVAAAAADNGQKLAGFDARSSAGVNFLLAQMSGAGNQVEKQQLETQKQIARNTGRPAVRVVSWSLS